MELDPKGMVQGHAICRGIVPETVVDGFFDFIIEIMKLLSSLAFIPVVGLLNFIRGFPMQPDEQ